MKGKKRVTIIEIAEACGVSKTTVGYALDEKTAFKVSPEKLELINVTAARLGYVPNHSAQSLRTRKTCTIGVMLPEPASSFFGHIALHLQRMLARKGYTALFVFWNNVDDSDSIGKAYRMLISRGVDGIITGGEVPGISFENSHVPAVFWQSAPKGFDSVSSYPHVRRIYTEIVGILKGKGCRKFALLAPFVDKGRSLQILEILKKEGVYPAKEHMVEGVNSYETAQDAMRNLLLLKKRPDAVLCNNDTIAISAMSEALSSGIIVPGEIKFVGFDGTDEALHYYPSLTTFHVSTEEVAEKLISLLFRRIEDRNSKILNLSIEPKLIIRDSI